MTHLFIQLFMWYMIITALASMIILIIDIIYVLQHQGRKYKAKREQQQLIARTELNSRGQTHIQFFF